MYSIQHLDVGVANSKTPGTIPYSYAYWLIFGMEKLSPNNIRAVVDSVIGTLDGISASKPAQISNATRSAAISVKRDLTSLLKRFRPDCDTSCNLKELENLLLDAVITLTSSVDYASNTADPITTQIESSIVDLCCAAKAMNLLNGGAAISPPNRAALLTLSAHSTFDGVTFLGVLWSFVNALLSLTRDFSKHPNSPTLTRLALSTATLSGLLYGSAAAGNTSKLSAPLKRISEEAKKHVTKMKASILLNAGGVSPHLEEELRRIEYTCLLTSSIVNGMKSESLEFRDLSRPHLVKFCLYDIVHTLYTLRYCAIKTYGFFPYYWGKLVDKTLLHLSPLEESLAGTRVKEDTLNKSVAKTTNEALKKLRVLCEHVGSVKKTPHPLLNFLISRAIDSCGGASMNASLSNTSHTQQDKPKQLFRKKDSKGPSLETPENADTENIRGTFRRIFLSIFTAASQSTEKIIVTIQNVRTSLQEGYTISPNEKIVEAVTLTLFYTFRHLLVFGVNSDLKYIEHELTQAIISLSECVVGNYNTDNVCRTIEHAVVQLCEVLKAIRYKSAASDVIRDLSSQNTQEYPCVHSAARELADMLVLIANHKRGIIKASLLKHAVLVASLAGVLDDKQHPQHRVAIEDMLIKEILSAQNIVENIHKDAIPTVGSDTLSSCVDTDLSNYIFSKALAAINPTEYLAPYAVRYSYVVKAQLLRTICAVRTISELLEEAPNAKEVKTSNVKEVLQNLESAAQVVQNTPANPSKKARKTLTNKAKKCVKTVTALATSAAKDKKREDVYECAMEAACACVAFFMALVRFTEFLYVSSYLCTDSATDSPNFNAEAHNNKEFESAYKKELKSALPYSTDTMHADATHRFIRSLVYDSPSLSIYDIFDVIKDTRLKLHNIAEKQNRPFIHSITCMLVQLLEHIVAKGQRYDIEYIESKLTDAVLAVARCISNNDATIQDGSAADIKKSLARLCRCLNVVQHNLRGTHQVTYSAGALVRKSNIATNCKSAASELANMLVLIANHKRGIIKASLLKHAVLVASLAGVLDDKQHPQHRVAIEDMLIKEILSAQNIVENIHKDAIPTVGSDTLSSCVDTDLSNYIFSKALAAINPTEYLAPYAVRYSYVVKAQLLRTICAVRTISELLEEPILQYEQSRRIKYKKKAIEIGKSLCAFAIAFDKTHDNLSAEEYCAVGKTAKKIHKSTHAFAKSVYKYRETGEEFARLAKDAETLCTGLYLCAATYKLSIAGKLRHTPAFKSLSLPGGSTMRSDAKASDKVLEKGKNGACSAAVTRVSATHSYIDRAVLSAHNLSPQCIGDILLKIKEELQKVSGAYERAINAVSSINTFDCNGDPQKLGDNLFFALYTLLATREEVRNLSVRGDTDLLGTCIVELGSCVKAVQLPVRDKKVNVDQETLGVSVINARYSDTLNAVAHALLAFARKYGIESTCGEHASLEETAVIIPVVAGLLDSSPNKPLRDKLATLVLKHVGHARKAIYDSHLDTEEEKLVSNNDRELAAFMCDFALAVFGPKNDTHYTLVHYSDFVRFNLLHVKYLTDSVREALLSVDDPLQDILKQHVLDVLDNLCVLESTLNEATPLTDAGLRGTQKAALAIATRLQGIKQDLDSCGGDVPQILTYYVRRALAACEACSNRPLAVHADPEITDGAGSLLRKLLINEDVMERALPGIKATRQDSTWATKLLVYGNAEEIFSSTSPESISGNQTPYLQENGVRGATPSSFMDATNLTQSTELIVTIH